MNESSSHDPGKDPSESSVLCSLAELMEFEEERISDEESAQRLQAVAEERRREAELFAKRKMEEQRIAEHEAAERARRFNIRKEEAELVALKQAEVERARAEVELKSRLQLQAQNHQHEAELVALASQSTSKKWRAAVVGVLLLGLIGGGAVVTLFAQNERTAVAEREAFQRQALELKEKVRENERKLQRQIDKRDAQQRERARILAEQARGSSNLSTRDSAALPPVKPPPTSSRRPTQTSPSPPPEPPCPRGDPMCPLD